jgi:hypothetical protein
MRPLGKDRVGRFIIGALKVGIVFPLFPLALVPTVRRPALAHSAVWRTSDKADHPATQHNLQVVSVLHLSDNECQRQTHASTIPKASDSTLRANTPMRMPVPFVRVNVRHRQEYFRYRHEHGLKVEIR